MPDGIMALIVVIACLLFHSATSRTHQPQIIQIEVAPQPQPTGGNLGCLAVVGVIVLLLLFSASGGH